MKCIYCDWEGDVAETLKRLEKHYGYLYVIYTCPKCHGDITYTRLEKIPADTALRLVELGIYPEEILEAIEILQGKKQKPSYLMTEDVLDILKEVSA